MREARAQQGLEQQSPDALQTSYPVKSKDSRVNLSALCPRTLPETPNFANLQSIHVPTKTKQQITTIRSPKPWVRGIGFKRILNCPKQEINPKPYRKIGLGVLRGDLRPEGLFAFLNSVVERFRVQGLGCTV